MQSERFIVNVQGRSSRVHVKKNLSTSDVSPFDTDDFTAIAPWMWRWREDTRVIPGLCKSELCAGPTAPDMRLHDSLRLCHSIAFAQTNDHPCLSTLALSPWSHGCEIVRVHG